MSASASVNKLQAIIARMREKEAAAKLTTLLEQEKPHEIDFNSLAMGDKPNEEHQIEVIQDIAASIPANGAAVALSNTHNQTLPQPVSSSTANDDRTVIGVARDIQLNEKQQRFQDTVLSGASCVLIGAAGTGKTTSMRSVTRALLTEQKLPLLTSGTKWLKVGLPGAAILSFTNKAVNNIRHAVVDELKPHTITAHKLLEFQPVFYEIFDEETQEMRKTMRFEATRGPTNPLPSNLVFLAWEESSMIGVPLYNLVQDAMPHVHQEVFLGDIQQLPPVFGLAVLGFKMLELPVVELTDIYRQAANSPIISLAHLILKGDPRSFSSKDKEPRQIAHPVTGNQVKQLVAPALAELTRKNEDGEVIFQPWQKSIEPEIALNAFANSCKHWIKTGYYDPEEDIILCPHNVGFGTIEINKKIADFLGRERGAVVWEVIAGFQKHYLAVGDRVLYDKEDATIVSIAHNGAYMGARAQIASETLDRWGHHQQKITQAEAYYAKQEAERMQEEAADFFLEGGGSDSEDRVNAASHVVTVRMRYATTENGEPEERVLESAGEINNLLGGYALTVHKYQGSEAQNVFLVLHQQHQAMCSREMLYTAVTRARRRLHIICEFTTFERGVQSQRIKGDTLEEKADFFKGKANKDETGTLIPLASHQIKMITAPAQVVAISAPSDQPVATVEEPKLTPVQSALAKLRALKKGA